jgi:hypothetical protein
VRWSHFRRNTVYYFCDNECLATWIANEPEIVARTIVTTEYQGDHRPRFSVDGERIVQEAVEP